MSNIKDFYESKRDELLYLELKENSKYNFPLPILKKDFVDEVKTGSFEEKIEFKYFFRGMVYNVAIDPNFNYSNDYLKILKNDIKDTDKIVLQEALKEMQEDVEIANIFLKFNYNNFKNVESNYYYASTLLNMFSQNNEKYLLSMAEEVLNKNLTIDDTYPLTYLLLGDIEKYNNNLVKANLYYKSAGKYIEKIEENQAIVDEINARAENINKEALYSEIKDLLNYSKYYEVVNKLKDLNDDDFRKYYYLGNAYLGLTKYEEAFGNYKKANEYEDKDLDFYIDYSYFLAEIGEVVLALEVINEGLKKYEDNESLLFNRALIYININEIEKAKEDLTNIVEYYDISEEIFNNSMILLEKIQNL